MTRQQHPAAWYPDPRDPTRLRRWNGRAWTGEVKPLPDWMRTLRLAQGPVDRPTNPAVRRLWVAAVLCLIAALALVDVVGRPISSRRRISDRSFVTAADNACANVNLALIEPNRKPLTGDAEVKRLEQLAKAQDQLVDDLRAIHVSDADREQVDGWLGAWAEWTTAGHRYAQAAADGDTAAMHDISQQSREPKAAIDSFALVNGMRDCVLFRP